MGAIGVAIWQLDEGREAAVRRAEQANRDRFAEEIRRSGRRLLDAVSACADLHSLNADERAAVHRGLRSAEQDWYLFSDTGKGSVVATAVAELRSEVAKIVELDQANQSVNAAHVAIVNDRCEASTERVAEYVRGVAPIDQTWLTDVPSQAGVDRSIAAPKDPKIAWRFTPTAEQLSDFLREFAMGEGRGDGGVFRGLRPSPTATWLYPEGDGVYKLRLELSPSTTETRSMCHVGGFLDYFATRDVELEEVDRTFGPPDSECRRAYKRFGWKPSEDAILGPASGESSG